MKSTIPILVIFLGVLGAVLYGALQVKDPWEGRPDYTGASGRRAACEYEGPFSAVFSRITGSLYDEEEVEYDETLKRAMFGAPPPGAVQAYGICDKPIIILEEEVEIVKEIPQGTSFDNLSNSSLEPSKWDDRTSSE